MDKNYIYTGMAVFWAGNLCFVVEKNRDTCKLLSTHSHDITEVTYDELDSCVDCNLKEYNRNIRTINCRSVSRLEKNIDKDYEYTDGSKVWFTSDTHFSHENILRFCQRPYNDVNEMNEDLINKWNDVVGTEDTVFHLGDFAWGGSEVWKNILSRLNGHIHLIIGNHDVKNLREGFHKYFESISLQRQITVEGRKIYLNHYPFLTWGGIYRRDEDKVWQLFGHVHSKNGQSGADSSRLLHLLPTQYDVGVDNNNYRLINFNEVKEIISKQIEEQKIDIDMNLEQKNSILMSLLTSEQLETYHKLIKHE